MSEPLLFLHSQAEFERRCSLGSGGAEAPEQNGITQFPTVGLHRDCLTSVCDAGADGGKCQEGERAIISQRPQGPLVPMHKQAC